MVKRWTVVQSTAKKKLNNVLKQRVELTKLTFYILYNNSNIRFNDLIHANCGCLMKALIIL